MSQNPLLHRLKLIYFKFHGGKKCIIFQYHVKALNYYDKFQVREENK